MFVPSHITGFFSIVDNNNILKKGSIGAGILIDKGVKTTITIDNNINNNIINTINNKKISNLNLNIDIEVNNSKTHSNNYIITKTIEKIFDVVINNIININNNGNEVSNVDNNINTNFNFNSKSNFNSDNDLGSLNSDGDISNKENSYNIKISQEIQVPVGCGFGSSASSVLGVSIGIARLFNISDLVASQIAHEVEVELGTGLGDIIAETSKGLVLRKTPGAPGIGEVESINDNLINDKLIAGSINSIYFVSKSIGEIETKSIIENNEHKKIINEIGEKYYNKFKSNPNLANFFKYSRKFAEETGLININMINNDNNINNYNTPHTNTTTTLNLQEIINTLDKDKLGLGSAMAMLGKTGFTLTKSPEKYDDSYLKAKIDLNGIVIDIKK